MIRNTPIMAFPALSDLLREIASLKEAADLIKKIAGQTSPYMHSCYKGLIPDDLVGAYRNMSWRLELCPTDMQVLGDLSTYMKAVAVLECVWGYLGAYPPTWEKDPVKGMISGETWRQVQRFFNFDDSE